MTVDKDATYYKNAVLSVIFVCFGYAFFNISDAVIKELGSNFHFSQILFTVYAIEFCLMALYGWKTEGKKAFRSKKIKTITLYSFFMISSVFCNIKALPNIQLTTFYTIIFSAPLWVALPSVFFLKDKISKERLGAIVFGFLVIVAIFRPWNGNFDIWAVIVLFSSVLCAGTVVTLRSISSSESGAFIMMSSAFWAMLMSSFFLFGNYISPSPHEWLLFLLAGIVLTLGTLCIIHGIHKTPSIALVAPYHYTQLIWGALIGYFVFEEVPSTDTMVGALLIIMSGLFLIYSEHRNSKKMKNTI